MKFRSDADFKRTLDIMKDLGLHITYSGTSGPALAPSRPDGPSRPSSAALPGEASHVSPEAMRRPASSFTISSSILRGSPAMRPEIASSPAKPGFKVPLRPDTAFSDQEPASRTPFSTRHMTNPFSSSPVSIQYLPYSPRSIAESFNHGLPRNHSLYVSQMEREVGAQISLNPIS
jgi:hypothetical protein